MSWSFFCCWFQDDLSRNALHRFFCFLAYPAGLSSRSFWSLMVWLSYFVWAFYSSGTLFFVPSPFRFALQKKKTLFFARSWRQSAIQNVNFFIALFEGHFSHWDIHFTKTHHKLQYLFWNDVSAAVSGLSSGKVRETIQTRFIDLFIYRSVSYVSPHSGVTGFFRLSFADRRSFELAMSNAG